MYRLMVVDDEMDVADFFSRMMAIKYPDTLEVLTCYSAEEALQTLDEFRIDIVVSDIKMPKMNGLEMYKVIHDKWPRCKIIFLSGILEFDYVYESIQNKDVHYLTKLEPKETILAKVQQVMDEIDERLNNEKEMIRIRNRMKESLPLLRNKCAEMLLLGVAESEEQLQRKLTELNVALDLNKGMAVIGAVFDAKAEEATSEGDSGENNIFVLGSVVNSVLEGSYELLRYTSMYESCYWVIQRKSSEEEQSKESLAVNLEYIQQEVEKVLGITVSFVYQKLPISYSQISEVFRNIRMQMGYMTGAMRNVIAELGTENSSESLLWTNKEVDMAWKQLARIVELEGSLELGKEQQLFDLLHMYLEPLKGLESFNYNPGLEVYYRVACVLLKYINEWKATEAMAFEGNLRNLMRIDEHKDWTVAVNYLYDIAKALIRTRFNAVKSITDHSVSKTIKYIQEHLDGDLSLSNLADVACHNPSYLSRLFKNQVGVNLYDYILELRMKKSVELLVKTNEQVKDIGKAVGYESTPSFTRAFRKYTGKTPSEYRTV